MAIDLGADLLFAGIAAGQMDEYVHTEVLFYPIGSVHGVALPQLTIGNWLEAMWRLQAAGSALDAGQSAAVDRARQETRRVRSLWPALYQRKAQREVKSRLDSWSWYLDDLLNKDAPLTPHSTGYASQARIRFKLELLRQDVSQLSDALSRLSLADRRLRTRFAAGAFIWEPELAPVAPPDEFWFLYGGPL